MEPNGWDAPGNQEVSSGAALRVVSERVPLLPEYSWPNGTELRTERARYVLVGTLGDSGHIETHLAYEILPEVIPHAVCVKRLLHNAASCGCDRRFRFVGRAKIGAGLAHPHLCSVIDRGEFEGVPFLVSETVDGLNLRAFAAFAGHKVPLPVVCQIGRQVASALAYIHNVRDRGGGSRGLVHGEVSPTSIIVGRDGVTKLSEAGLSPMGEPRTFACAGPEHVNGHGLDGRSDLFSLGVCLVELLSGSPVATHGRLDFEGLRNEVKMRCDARADVSAQMGTVLLSLTALKPDDRPPDAEAVIEALDEVEASCGAGPELEETLGSVFERATPGNSPARLPEAFGHIPHHAEFVAPTTRTLPFEDEPLPTFDPTPRYLAALAILCVVVTSLIVVYTAFSY